MKIKAVFGLFLCLLLCGCGEDVGYEYSNYHCNLGLDNSTHLDPTLASAMNATSPGVFCTISYSYSNAFYYVFSSNQGQKTTSIFNAIDQRMDNQQRMGRNNGLIVGFGNLDNPAIFYAYDAECPNCYNPSALPVRSYKLSVSSSGIATCANCKRSYNLNTGGNIVAGSTGNLLERYRATTTGPNGLLHVY